MKKLLLPLLLIPTLLAGQTSKHDSIWIPVKSLIGDWVGKGGGEPGTGDYTRSYKWIFNEKYIEVRNKSVYPPSKNFPKGEIHEDLGYISYDKIRNTFVLRQFHTEGFVNQYKLDSISADKKTLVFVSEAIENIPAGWRAKETYKLLNNGEFEETFELAEPGQEYQPYSRVKLTKKK